MEGGTYTWNGLPGGTYYLEIVLEQAPKYYGESLAGDIEVDAF